MLTHANGAALSRRGTKRCLRDGAYRRFSTLYNDLIYPTYLDCCDRLGSGTMLRGSINLKMLDVRFWHKADLTALLIHVRFWGNSGHR